MQQLAIEAAIPKFTLEPDPEVGNKMFRMNKIVCGTKRMRSEFLVPHRKDYHFLMLVKQGSSRHWIDMTPYTVKPDNLYFTVPHQVHLKEVSEPATGMSVSFTSEFLALEENSFLKQLPIIRNPQNGHELRLSPADLVFLDDMFEKIYQEYHTKNSWQHGMLTAYMQVLLIYLSRLYTEQLTNAEAAPEKMLLKKYLSEIEKSFKEHHTVAAYAEMLNISAGHLSESVKELSGKSAIAHIHERLVLEARRLLFHTEESIKEIAFGLGFEDASYFNRFFKRVTGQTPLEYRTVTREMYH